MKKARIRVRRNCGLTWYDFGIYSGQTNLWFTSKVWQTKETAIRHAKVAAESLGIPYDPKIIRDRTGC